MKKELEVMKLKLYHYYKGKSMQTIAMLIVAITMFTLLSCTDSNENTKPLVELRNPIMPLTVGNWWKYHKRFGADTNEYQVWRVTNVERGSGSVTATISYYSYNRNTMDTLSSGIFYMYESDTMLISSSTPPVIGGSVIPNKSQVYRTDSTDSRITEPGMYFIGQSDSVTVPAGTFYNVMIFGQYDRYGQPAWTYDAGEIQFIKSGIGVLETSRFRWEFELVEYSLVSKN